MKMRTIFYFIYGTIKFSRLGQFFLIHVPFLDLMCLNRAVSCGHREGGRQHGSVAVTLPNPISTAPQTYFEKLAFAFECYFSNVKFALSDQRLAK